MRPKREQGESSVHKCGAMLFCRWTYHLLHLGENLLVVHGTAGHVESLLPVGDG